MPTGKPWSIAATLAARCGIVSHGLVAGADTAKFCGIRQWRRRRRPRLARIEQLIDQTRLEPPVAQEKSNSARKMPGGSMPSRQFSYPSTATETVTTKAGGKLGDRKPL